jgi:glycosyltransferase involved in cell wall biosynthesis
VVALLVGRGEDESDVRAQVDRLGLVDSVRFTGYRNDVPDLLVASDASVLTSLYEGIPRALMEAMVVGLPVVATDVPGTRTLVAHGVTGFLSAPGDVQSFAFNLQRLRSEPATSTELGVNGRRRVESRFDESAVTDRVLTIYEHVRARTPGPLPQWDPAEPEEAASESV